MTIAFYFFVLLFMHIISFVFFFNDPATTEISPLSLPDALPIPAGQVGDRASVIEQCANRRGLPGRVLEREPGWGRSLGDELANRVEAVRAPGQGLAGLVEGDLRVELGQLAVPHVGKVRNHEIRAGRAYRYAPRQLEFHLETEASRRP